MRRCPNCGAMHHPRTDPVVIMLVHDGAERVLLGRQKVWPPGRYSTLAGFVEPGESLEEAVAREVLEESGIEVGEVLYRSSQPWPFPTSLMLGFHATYAGGEPVIGDGELEDVRWFDRDELVEIARDDKEIQLPPPLAIARQLIDEWLGSLAATELPARGERARELGLALPPERMPLLRRRPPAEALALGRRVRARADALRGRRADRPAAAALVGGGAAGSHPARADHGGAWRRGAGPGRGARAREHRPDLDEGDGVDVVSPRGRARLHLDAQAGRRASPVARCLRPRDRGPRGRVDDSAGYHERHTDLALVGRRRADADGRARGVEPRRRRARRAGGQRAHRLAATASRARSGPVEFARRPLGTRSPTAAAAFSEWSAREEHTQPLLLRSELPAAVRNLQRRATRRRSRLAEGTASWRTTTRSGEHRRVAQPRAARWRVSSATSSFVVERGDQVAQRLGAGLDQLHRARRAPSRPPGGPSAPATSSFTSSSSARL